MKNQSSLPATRATAMFPVVRLTRDSFFPATLNEAIRLQIIIFVGRNQGSYTGALVDRTAKGMN